MSGKTMRLPCQVCGRQLALLTSGLVKPHKAPGHRGRETDRCRGTGYRHARWKEGQTLQHYSGSVWVVVKDRGGQYGDYFLRCIDTSRALSDQELGREMTAHGEYMHRHGWTPIEDDCMCGCGFDRHDHRRIDPPCRDCEEPYECSAYEPDLAAPTQQKADQIRKERGDA